MAAYCKKITHMLTISIFTTFFVLFGAPLIYAAEVTSYEDTWPTSESSTWPEWQKHRTEYKVLGNILKKLTQGGYIDEPEPDNILINKYTPPRFDQGNSAEGHALTGCGPLAMGTIENYHLRPDGYSLIHGRINDDLAKLITNHGTVSEWFPQVTSGIPNTNYSDPDGTSFEARLTDEVMGVFGYEVEWFKPSGNTDRERATSLYQFTKAEINAGRPVLLFLNSDLRTGEENHAIVISGYKKHSWQLLPYKDDLRKEDLFLYTIFGWGGEKNIWWQIDKKTVIRYKAPLMAGGGFYTIEQVYDLDRVFACKISPRTDNTYDYRLTDVPTNHWAYSYIRQLHESGVVKGYSLDRNKNYFLPDAEIKRSEAVALILRAANISVPTNEHQVCVDRARRFRDLDNSSNEQLLACIGKAIERGFINPYSDNNQFFRPNNSITRGEFSKVLVHARNATGRTLAENRTFTHPGPYGELEGFMVQLYKANIIDGYKIRNHWREDFVDLRVDGKIKRSEAAKFIYYAFK